MLTRVGLLLVFVINLLITRKKDRTVLNPSILFTTLWTFIVFLASLRCIELYPASAKSYLIIFLGVLSFTIGSSIANLLNNVHCKRSRFASNITLRYNLLCICAMICIMYYLPGLIRSIRLMAQGASIGDMRSVIQNTELASGWNNFVPNFIILPLAISLEVLAIADFFLGKHHRGLFATTATLVAVRVLGDGGRTPVFNLLIYFLAMYMLAKYDNKENSRLKKSSHNKKKIIVIIILIVIFLVIITFIRSDMKIISAFRILYFYFAMPPVLLSWWTDYIDMTGVMGNGLVSLNGAFYLVEYFIKNLLTGVYNEPIKVAYDLVALTDSTWIRIAPPSSANAYVSCFFFFYADGRFYTVVAFSLIYGFALSLMYNTVIASKDIRKTTLYLFLYQGLVFSFIRFQFVKAYYVIAILFIYFIAFKKDMITRTE